MSISNGQAGNATNFNGAFVSRAAEQTVAGGKRFTNYISFTESAVASAATITAMASSTSKVRLTGSTATELQGVTAGVSGQVLIIYNATNQTMTVKHQNVGASAADRIITYSGGDLSVLAGDSLMLSYDGTQSRWVQSSVTQSESSDITALTGDVTASGSGSVTATISNDAVSNAKLANMANGTIKGRTNAGTGDPEDLTGAQATALLSNMVGDSGSGGTKGLAPAPASGDSAAGKFLKADGTWAVPTFSPTAKYIISYQDTGRSYVAGDRIQFNTSLYDTTSGAVTTGSSWKFQPNRAAYYLVSSSVLGTTGSQAIAVYKNGSIFKHVASWNAGTNVMHGQGSCIVYLNGSSDYIDLRSEGSFSNFTTNSYAGAASTANFVDIVEL